MFPGLKQFPRQQLKHSLLVMLDKILVSENIMMVIDKWEKMRMEIISFHPFLQLDDHSTIVSIVCVTKIEVPLIDSVQMFQQFT